MLLDRCSRCGVAVAVHRIDMVRLETLETGLISYCYACGFDLRDAPKVEPISYDFQASTLLYRASRMLGTYNLPCSEWNLGRYAVMHQLCRIMTAKYKHVHLREFVLAQVGFQDIPLTAGHISFAMRPIEERHHLAQLTAWLLVDIELRLTAAWRARAVRYNVLLKDFTDRPKWYSEIVGNFENWRDQFHP
ncbi:MAG: tniQ family protein [Herminiimonas sp.]|nr:tniQ family protein [Herminiimonas sp.]